MSEDPTDKRFSQIYLGGTDRLQDSKRARVRVSALLSRMEIHSYQIDELVQHELGVTIPFAGSWDIAGFINRCELRDFLDLISLVASRFSNNMRVAKNWLPECSRIFAEEHLRYTINDAGGVRFAADSYFEVQVQATIANLGAPNLTGALQSFERALDAMSEHPTDGKTAIREVFESVEIAFKTLCSGPSRIGDTEITKQLIPYLDKTYANNQTARLAANKLARSLAEWVNASHFYRHGQTGGEPVHPPAEIAITLVSEGAAFLRWFAALNANKAL